MCSGEFNTDLCWYGVQNFISIPYFINRVYLILQFSNFSNGLHNVLFSIWVSVVFVFPFSDAGSNSDHTSHLVAMTLVSIVGTQVQFFFGFSYTGIFYKYGPIALQNVSQFVKHGSV